MKNENIVEITCALMHFLCVDKVLFKWSWINWNLKLCSSQFWLKQSTIKGTHTSPFILQIRRSDKTQPPSTWTAIISVRAVIVFGLNNSLLNLKSRRKTAARGFPETFNFNETWALYVQPGLRRSLQWRGLEAQGSASWDLASRFFAVLLAD